MSRNSPGRSLPDIDGVSSLRTIASRLPSLSRAPSRISGKRYASVADLDRQRQRIVARNDSPDGNCLVTVEDDGPCVSASHSLSVASKYGYCHQTQTGTRRV
jgi:hypothetical protein